MTIRKNNVKVILLPGKIYPYLKQALIILLLTALLQSSACAPRIPFSQDAPVEPVIWGLERSGDLYLRGRFSVVNPEMTVHALAISSSGSEIIFSLDARSINMLDDQGRLRWEFFPEGSPVAADLTSDGCYVAVGTDLGKLYFLRNDGHVLWENLFEGRPRQLALDPEGNYLAVSIEEEDGYMLYYLDKWGTPLGELKTGMILDLKILPGGELYYLEKGDQINTLVILSMGDLLWEEKALLSSVSGCGNFVVTYTGEMINFYSLRETAPPVLLSSHSINIEISWLDITEGGEQVLAYSAFSGGSSNLFAFHKDGHVLWKKRIPDGSLIRTSFNGERIVASSWREYSDDFSMVLVLDNNGNTLQKIEMASRIEKMALANDGTILTLAGSYGNIFILDIPGPGIYYEETEKADFEQGGEIYRPVAFERPGDEFYLTLYFYDEEAVHLIPVNRNVKRTLRVLQVAVNELVKGPRRFSGLSRTIPKDTGINVVQKDGLTEINLPGALNRLGGSSQIVGIIDSLIFTVSQFNAVEGIRFLVDGQYSESFGAEGLIIDQVFPPRHPGENNRMLLYLPYRSGERYYLLPREAVQLGGKFNTPHDLVRILLEESSSLLPELLELNKITVLREEIILDWGPSFKKLFPPDANPQEKALAALFLDALLLTLTNNLEPDQLVFLVDGVAWEPPSEYPPLNRIVKRPFYINPE
ncbi:MAG: GerMN domain-containing protein [Bacillota bacterium]|nr:GerMN domain-containing protein [Bacillota bacterium]